MFVMFCLDHINSATNAVSRKAKRNEEKRPQTSTSILRMCRQLLVELTEQSYTNNFCRMCVCAMSRRNSMLDEEAVVQVELVKADAQTLELADLQG